MSSLPENTLQDISVHEFDEMLFVKHYIDTGTAKEAYKRLKPHVTDTSAEVLGHRMLRRVKFGNILEQMGLTDRTLATLIVQGTVKPTRKVVKKVKKFIRPAVNTVTTIDPLTKVKITKEVPVTDKSVGIEIGGKDKEMLWNHEEVMEYEYEDVPDYQVREKYLSAALKLKRHLQDAPGEGNGGVVNNGVIQIINYGDKKIADEVQNGIVIQEQVPTETTQEMSPDPVQRQELPSVVQVTDYSVEVPIQPSVVGQIGEYESH